MNKEEFVNTFLNSVSLNYNEVIQKSINLYYEEFHDYEIKLDELCINLVYNFIYQNLQVETTIRYVRADIINNLRILPEFVKLLDYIFYLLKSFHFIKEDNNHIQFMIKPNEQICANLIKELKYKFPSFAALTDFIVYAISSYNSSLTGEIPAISILYPGGNSELLTNSVEKIIENYSQSRTLIHILLNFLSNITASKHLNILEIGAGKGLLTIPLIQQLQPQNFSYTFTDIGRKFVVNMQHLVDKYRYKNFSCLTLDIAKDPISQGFKAESFDCIISYEVIHATPDLEQTILNLKKLLVPNGMLCIIESVKDRKWINLAIGLAKGWWYFNDKWRSNTPLTSQNNWKNLLEVLGFSTINITPCGLDQQEKTDSCLIIAIK